MATDNPRETKIFDFALRGDFHATNQAPSDELVPFAVVVTDDDATIEFCDDQDRPMFGVAIDNLQVTVGVWDASGTWRPQFTVTPPTPARTWQVTE